MDFYRDQIVLCYAADGLLGYGGEELSSSVGDASKDLS